jgi:hypothetical protein
MTDWRDIPEWCLGANDEFGTCAFAMVGNHVVLLGRGVMNDGEVLNAAREIEGLNTQDRTTDKGENLEALFGYVQAEGWPADPTLTINAWCEVDLDQVPGVIARRQASEAWLMLPMLEDGSDYDFTDDAVVRGAEGRYAHAVLIVEASNYGLTFITWARPQGVSRAWADRYVKGCYDVEWTDIT